MRILFLLPRAPYPPTNGASIEVFRRIRGLALRGHELSAVAFCGTSPGAQEEVGPLRQFCRLRLVPAQLDNSWTTLARNCLSTTPYIMEKYANPAYRRCLVEALKAESPSLVQFEHFQQAQYLAEVRQHSNAPAILREHSVDSVVFGRIAAGALTPLRLYARLQAEKLLRSEKRLLPSFDLCLAVSTADAAHIRRICPRTSVAVAGVEVDLEYFRPRPGTEEPGLIVWAGDLRWRPNSDGLLWFCREVLPLIRRQAPMARLCVAGHLPSAPRWRQKLPRDVEISGFVPDIRPFMARASLIIAPLFAGGGVKVKILNALAMGKAVITTSVGLEGIAARPGMEIECADDAESFAGLSARILTDENMRRDMGAAGRAFVEREHAPGLVLDQLEEQYKHLLRCPATSREARAASANLERG